MNDDLQTSAAYDAVMDWPAIKVGNGDCMQMDGASRAEAVARAAKDNAFKTLDLHILVGFILGLGVQVKILSCIFLGVGRR